MTWIRSAPWTANYDREMRVLVLDDTLKKPDMVSYLLLDLAIVSTVVVSDSLARALENKDVDVVILGGRFLTACRQLREAYPKAYIIGRGPWMKRGDLDFFPWGDELRDPSVPLHRLLGERPKAKDDTSAT